ncbi:hypothetical protein BOX37_07260 [Nocardia mangyaensis]|uniref:Uncharacterized protein n=1 Tax=Nocardia mangyaensis TaxID=2213200 RepID=A0A1J0VP38_9NOCA|nr:hypothetical protein [Nocardia mangyaensis]APE33803.1 hypothetical protein BOX37_07260 [Nocardia mangyaensis]
MTNALTDLDQINAELMTGSARNPFGRDVAPGDGVSGEIIAVIRRHRHNSQGQPLFWVNRRPQVAATGDPVIDSQLILETDDRADDEDDGLAAVTMDRDVQRAIRAGVRRARANGVAIGGRLDGLLFVGPAEGGNGRVYDLGSYTPPA